jgi:hypothetical protein
VELADAELPAVLRQPTQFLGRSRAGVDAAVTFFFSIEQMCRMLRARRPAPFTLYARAPAQAEARVDVPSAATYVFHRQRDGPGIDGGVTTPSVARAHVGEGIMDKSAWQSILAVLTAPSAAALIGPGVGVGQDFPGPDPRLET